MFLVCKAAHQPIQCTIEKEITNYTRTNSSLLLLGDFNARTNCYPDYTIIDTDSKIINIEGDVLDFVNDIYKIESYSVAYP